MEKSVIECPNCHEQIDVQSVLSHQLEDQIRMKFEAEQRKKEQVLSEKMKEIEEKEKSIRAAVELQVEEGRKALAKELKEKIAKEQEEANKALNEELKQKSEQLKEYNKTLAEVERLKREASEAESKATVKAEKELTKRLEEEREKREKELAEEQERFQVQMRKKIDEENELRIKALQKRLDDQMKLTEEMKRKQEQGSMQMQGEILELVVEEFLASEFPLDTIDEVKKGDWGADCLQIVNTRSVVNCGKIYYESKNTKAFNNQWIEKFKKDMRDKGADIGVLVTTTMPNDMDRMGLKDGVWVCTLSEFKGLCHVLRKGVVDLSMAKRSSQNIEGKMGMLYEFLTSTEFKLYVEGIVDGFVKMQDDLNKEKRAMMKIWNSREKQLNLVIENTMGMYGSIKGIAGNSIQDVKGLEMGDLIDEDSEEVDE